MRQGWTRRSGLLISASLLLAAGSHGSLAAEDQGPAPNLQSLIQALAKMPDLKRDTIEKLVGAKFTTTPFAANHIKLGNATVSIQYLEDARLLILSSESECLELADISARYGPLRKGSYMSTDGGPWGTTYSRRLKWGMIEFWTDSSDTRGPSCITSVRFDHFHKR